MDWCMMTKVKGYLVWVLVFYTVFVTYFLVLSAWSDDLDVKKRHGRDDKLIHVLYQEEKRHLRSFKDVVKTYGGMVGLTIRQKSNQDANSEGDTAANKSKSDNPGDGNNSTNIVGIIERPKEAGGDERPKFTVEVESWEEAIMGKSRFHKSFKSRNSDRNEENKNSSMPYNDNIFIEDNVPSPDKNSTGVKNSKQIPISNSKVYINDKNTGQIDRLNKSALHDDKHSKARVDNIGSSSSGTVTEYCDKIDAEEPYLCLSERVTLSHPNHVNITTNHMSFKPIGDLYIYSGFLDTRRKPASIRFMVIAPRGRDTVRNSGYWCAFNLPAVLSQRFYWNGLKEPPSVKPGQASQLDYYAASDGHNKKSQFYIMSCAVPGKHLPTLLQFETSRIHIVAGSKESPLLDTVQERIAVDVLNNQGLPWHEMIKRSAVLGEVFQINNNSKSNNKTDDNTQPQHVVHNNTNNINTSQHVNPSDQIFNPVSSQSSKPNSIISCIAPIFTAVSVVQMVEFLELTLLLGSQHIVLYILHLPDDVRDVLAMYRYKGLITVLPWPVPSPASIWANGRDIALTDCLYRSMYKYEFAIFHDMDEFFVPRNTPDLPSFINFLYLKAGMKRNRTSDILFSSAYFSPPNKVQTQSLLTQPGYTKDVSKFSSLRSIHRTYFNSEHTLRMIRPIMAVRVGGGERKRTVFTISSRYAAVNHYSKCVGTSQPNAVNNSSAPSKKDAKSTGVDCSATKVDMHLWRIKDKLIRQTKESIRDLNSKHKRSSGL